MIFSYALISGALNIATFMCQFSMKEKICQENIEGPSLICLDCSKDVECSPFIMLCLWYILTDCVISDLFVLMLYILVNNF